MLPFLYEQLNQRGIKHDYNGSKRIYYKIKRKK